MKYILLLLTLAACAHPDVNKRVVTPEEPNNKLQARAAQMECQAMFDTTTFICMSPSEKVVYLTFDDGPSKFTIDLMKVLTKHDVSATFFMLGSQIERFPNAAKAVVANGHVVGNHSYAHEFIPKLPDEDVRYTFRRTNSIIQQHVGYYTNIIRIPWGNIRNTQLKLFSPSTKIYHWSINTDDWKFNKEKHGVDSIYHRIVDYAHNGAIILCHDGGGDRSKTVTAVDRAIATLKNDGWEFKTLPHKQLK